MVPIPRPRPELGSFLGSDSLEKRRIQAQARPSDPGPKGGRLVDFAKVQNFMVSGYFSIPLDPRTSPIKRDLKIFSVGASRLKFYSMTYYIAILVQSLRLKKSMKELDYPSNFLNKV